MNYKNEWFLLEADDDIDEIEHREPTEEFLFYRAVATGDVDKVRQNCEQGRFVEGEGVGILSRDPVINLKYHNSDDHAALQAEWHGVGAGVPAE